jgi:hypothetical protein
MKEEPMPELPCCPVHEELLRNGGTKPFDNCIVCIRNERDELREAMERSQRDTATECANMASELEDDDATAGAVFEVICVRFRLGKYETNP